MLRRLLPVASMLLLLALGLSLSSSRAEAQLQSFIPSGQVIACNNSAVISTAAGGNTQLISLQSGQTIYVCGYNFMAGGTTNFKFVYGTGTACATGQTDLTGAYPLISQTGVSYGAGVGTVIRTPASNALCVNNSAAVQVSGVVSYAQY